MAHQKYKVIVPADILTEELAYWLGFILAVELEPKLRGDNFYVVETCGKKARLVAKTLYDGATIALPRKALLAGGV